MTGNEIASILGGFGVALLALLGTMSNNKKSSTDILIQSYEKMNHEYKLEIESLKKEIKSQDIMIDELKQEILELQRKVLYLEGAKDDG